MQKSLTLCILLFSIGCFSQDKLDVFFDFNQDMPNESSQIRINQWVLDNKNSEVTKVFGYCDSVDNSKYNKDLALRRVNSMISFF
jgi:outer membrane protein OmpA-like peptidoglycan-associated protein